MTKKEKAPIENENVCGVLSYFIVGIIWYFADENMKKSDFARYHTKQSIVLIIASIIYGILLNIFISIFFVPIIMTGIWIGLSAFRVLYYIPLIWAVIGAVNAAKGEKKPLPLIGKFADKFKF